MKGGKGAEKWDVLAAFRDAQKESSAKGGSKKHGSAKGNCLLGTLNVKTGHDGKTAPKGKIEVKIEGPCSRTMQVASGQTATFSQLSAGTYKVTSVLKGWRQKAPDPAEAKIIGAAKKSVALTLFPCTLTKVTPTGSPSPEKKYINTDGREVEIEAHLSSKVPGIPVYFTLDAHPKNKTGLLPALQASLSAASAQTDADGVAKTTLTLSRYGGDRFRVSASLEQNQRPGSKNAKESKWFQIWRKVYCEVDFMKRDGGGSYSNRSEASGMKAEYRKHFVEILDTGSDSSPVHERTVTENDAAAYCQGLRSGTDTPMVHFVYLDSIIWDPADQTQILTLKKTRGTKDFQAKNTTLHLLDSTNPNRWLKGNVIVEITRKTGNNPPAATSHYLPNPTAHLTMTSVKDCFRLSWDLRNVLGFGNEDRFPAGVTQVRMQVVLEVWEEGSGLAAGGASIVGMRFRERSYMLWGLSHRVRNTMIHESGHNMGLASKFASDGTEPGSYYYKCGGHCHGNSNKCVMYEALVPQYLYCDVCSDALRARDLSALPVSGESGM